MRKVFLDNNNLTTLANVRANDAPRFERFLRTWRERECELVFTRGQLMETRQNSVAQTRMQRYELLSHMLPIHSDIITREPAPEIVALLSQREIIRAAIARGWVRLDGDTTLWERDHTIILPGLWTAPFDVWFVQQSIESELLGTAATLMKSAAQTQAEAQRRDEDTPFSRARLDAIPQEPLSAEQVEKARREFRAGAAMDDAQVAKMFPFHSLEEARAILEQTLGVFERMIERQGVVGPRRAYEEMMAELVGALGVPERRRPYLDEVTAQSLFEHDVRRVATDLLRATPQQADAMARQMSIAECPARWLVRAVELEIGRNERDPDASNMFDLEHLQLLPYVDVFCTDQRIGTYATAVLRRADLPEPLRELPRPKWVRASVDALEAAIAEG